MFHNKSGCKFETYEKQKEALIICAPRFNQCFTIRVSRGTRNEREARSSPRKAALENALSFLSGELQNDARRMLHYTAGLWPSPDAIVHRKAMTEALEKDIASFSGTVAAIGECGIDRHWNPSGEDGRCESGKTDGII